MNAKKISALVLAAVMAAGTTTVAFARANEDYPLDIPDRQWENVYVEKDGVLKEVQKGDVVTPGTTLYIRLDEYSKAETKDKNKSKVYAEWKVGKDMVEDIDIVYKKGEWIDTAWNTDYTYTVDGVDFTVDGKKAQTNLQIVIEDQLAEYKKDHKDFLADEIMREMRNYVDKGYEMTKTGAFYTNVKDLLVDGCGYVYDDYYEVNGKTYADDDIASFLTGSTGSCITDWYVTAADAAKGYGEIIKNPADATGLVPVTGKDYVNVGGKDILLDTAKIDSMTKLAATGLYDVEFAGNYKDGAGKVYTEDAAYNAELALGTVKTAGFQDGNGQAIESSKAYEYAKNTVIFNESVKAAENATKNIDSDYTYWVAIDTKDDDTTALLDLAGSIYVGTTKSKAYDANAYDLDFTFSNRVDDYSDADVVEDEYTFKPDSRAVVKFAKDAEDVTLYFGSEEDIWYEFDARSQSALNFAFTFDYNREIAADYPEANIDFITWTAQPSTNRTGTLYITADPDSFIYEISEDGKTLKEVANAEYNEDEEAWEIRTRKLVGYAISDKELDLVEDTTSSSTGSNTGSNNGGKDNPDTGR